MPLKFKCLIQTKDQDGTFKNTCVNESKDNFKKHKRQLKVMGDEHNPKKNTGKVIQVKTLT